MSIEITIWLAALLLAVVLLYLGWRALGNFFFTRYSKPKIMPIDQRPSDYGLRYRDIEFETEDGIELKAWLVLPPDFADGERRPAVITTHGYSTNRSDIIVRTVAVAKAGFVAFTFDWRRCGESEGEASTGGVAERMDIRAAVNTLTQQHEIDPTRIAIYGFSMGAVMAILHAADDKRIKAVAADSPYVNMKEITRQIIRSMFIPPNIFMASSAAAFKRKFGAPMESIDVAAAAARISPRPLLILKGEKDRVVPPWHPQAVFDAALEPKRIEINPNGGHFDNASPETLAGVVIPFLRGALT